MKVIEKLDVKEAWRVIESTEDAPDFVKNILFVHENKNLNVDYLFYIVDVNGLTGLKLGDYLLRSYNEDVSAISKDNFNNIYDILEED
jgi:hypothetical protein